VDTGPEKQASRIKQAKYLNRTVTGLTVDQQDYLLE
jgi:hypothetical protein